MNQYQGLKSVDTDEQNTAHFNIAAHLPRIASEQAKALAVVVQKAADSLPFMKGVISYHEMNFHELNQQSDHIAYALEHYGIEKGQRVVLMVKPSLEFFALTFGLFKMGAIPIMVDPGMGIKNLKKCFEEAQPQVFIGISKAHVARILFAWGKESLSKFITVGPRLLWQGKTLKKIISDLATIDKPYPIKMLPANDMAAILFTSGSTGTPKGVVYSHKMFEAQVNILKRDYAIEPGEKDLATFPLFSLFGPALGMTSIIPEMDASKPITANPNYIFQAVQKYKCTNMFANPALIEILGSSAKKQKIKLNTIRRVISAGAPATMESIQCFSGMLEEGVEILTSYGATESLPISKIGSIELLGDTIEQTRLGEGICVGRPVEDLELNIITLTDQNIPDWNNDLLLPVGIIGEIVVKGPVVSRAYYNRDKATCAAKIDAGNNEFYHRMGDVGYLDKQGRLWMCGRKAHRVETISKTLFSIPCERIFNVQKNTKRTALVGVEQNGKNIPVICIELNKDSKNTNIDALFSQMAELAAANEKTNSIQHFLVHPKFPVDVRHNAKIFREKLAVWASDQLKGKAL